MDREFRLVKAYGRFNERWEIQEKYTYYENGIKVEAWGLVYHSMSKDSCEDVLNRFQTQPPRKNFRLTVEEAIAAWN